MYIKAFTNKLQGYGGYQFEVGKTYTTDTSDNWRWFHYANTLTETLKHYKEAGTRFCEVVPIGRQKHFKSSQFNYWSTDSIYIQRELPAEEIYKIILNESPKYYLIRHLNLPYEVVKCILPKRLPLEAKYDIIRRKDLSYEQKKMLLPKSYCKYIGAYC